MIREVIKCINNSKITIEDKCRFIVKVQNHQLLKLYGLPKIHKPGKHKTNSF